MTFCMHRTWRSQTGRGCCALLLLLWTSASCPSSQTSHSDAGTEVATLVLDGGCVALGHSCSQVGDCASACGADQSCVDSCSAQGCASAREAFAEVQSCTIHNCLVTCAAGSGPDCDACSTEHCGPAQDVCEADQCPLRCQDPSAPADASLDAMVWEDGATALACIEVLDCFSDCLVETPQLCVQPCRQRACAEARTALDTLLTCADQNCKDLVEDRRCFVSYSSSDCRQCMQQKCSAHWGACSAQRCP